MASSTWFKKLFYLFFCLLSTPCFAWNATVLQVYDGDTLTVQNVDTQEKIKIRLYGIDTPELPSQQWLEQPYSTDALHYLKELLPSGSLIAVVDMGLDRYKRTVASVVALPSGMVLQEELLNAGLAWVYPQYCKNCKRWQNRQSTARQERKGLWGEDSPTPPWEWRKKAKD